MDIESFRAYCLAKKAVTESFPFDSETLVFKVMGKMFALVSLESIPPQVNLKCDPGQAIELREIYEAAVFPGYHMSKIHWNTILIGRLPAALIRELTDHFYDLVTAKLPKRLRAELDGME